MDTQREVERLSRMLATPTWTMMFTAHWFYEIFSPVRTVNAPVGVGPGGSHGEHQRIRDDEFLVLIGLR